MAFLCPSRVGQSFGKSKTKGEKLTWGRITGSDSVDTLVRVGLEKQHGLPPSSYRIIKEDFVPGGGREIAVHQDEGVYILYTENDWTYIIKKDGIEGFVPSSLCILPCGNKTRSDSSFTTDPNNNGKEKFKIVTGSNDSFDDFKGGLPDMANGYNIGSKAENTYSTPRVEANSQVGTFSSMKNTKQNNHDEQTTKDILNGTSQEAYRVAAEIVPFRKTSHGQFIVLFDFEAQEENDVSVERAEIVNVLNIEDPDWSWVKRYHGEEGFVPKSYICPVEPLKSQERLQRQKNKVNNSFGSSSASSSLSVSSTPLADKHKPSTILGPNNYDSPYRLQTSISSQDFFFPVTSSPKNTPDHAKLCQKNNQRPFSTSTPNLAKNKLPDTTGKAPPSYEYHLLRASRQANISNYMYKQTQNQCVNNSGTLIHGQLKSVASNDHAVTTSLAPTTTSSAQTLCVNATPQEPSTHFSQTAHSHRINTNNQYQNSGPSGLNNDCKMLNCSSRRPSDSTNDSFTPTQFTEKSSPTSGPIVKPQPVLMPLSVDSDKTKSNHKCVTFKFYDGQSDIDEGLNSSFESQMEEQLSITDFNLSIIRQNDIKSITIKNDEKVKSKSTVEVPAATNKPKIRIPKPKAKLDDSMISDITEFVLLYDYQARSMDDLSVNQGERVFSDVQTNCNQDWIWAYSPQSSKYGFVPKVYLDPTNKTVL